MMHRLATVVAVALGSCASLDGGNALKFDPKRESFLGTAVEKTGNPSDGELQVLLDKFCQGVFDGACGRYPSFCGKKAVARKDRGHEGQPEKLWRCYNVNIIDHTLNTAMCVTDCGIEVPCRGGVNPNTSDHSSRHMEILRHIAENLESTCPDEGLRYTSALQQQLDDFCTERMNAQCDKGLNCKGKAVARKAHDNGSQESQEWRCYLSEAISNRLQNALCITDCGVEVLCHDGIVEKPSKDHYISFTAEIARIISDNYRRTCEERSKEQERRERARLLKGGRVQTALNNHCSEVFERKCGENESEFCSPAVARKASDGDEWKCYSSESMLMTEKGSLCVDDCGKVIPCLGSQQEEGAAAPVGSTDFLQQLVEDACPEPQRAAQNVCDRKASSSDGSLLARKSGDAWSCIPAEDIDYEATGTCFDGCKNEVTCAGAPSKETAGSHGTVSEIISDIENIFLCHQGTCMGMSNEPARCEIKDDLTLGRSLKVELAELRQKFSIWIGNCLSTSIIPEESTSTASILISEGGNEGGFVTNHNSNYSITISRGNDGVVISVISGAEKQESTYFLKGGSECDGRTDVQYSRLPKDVVLTVDVVAAGA